MRTLARGSLGVCQGQGARTYLAKGHLSPHRASAQADVARTSGKKDNLVGVVFTPTQHICPQMAGDMAYSWRVSCLYWAATSPHQGVEKDTWAEIAWEAPLRRIGWHGLSEDSQCG